MKATPARLRKTLVAAPSRYAQRRSAGASDGKPETEGASLPEERVFGRWSRGTEPRSGKCGRWIAEAFGGRVESSRDNKRAAEVG
jgi:hypothetical protein